MSAARVPSAPATEPTILDRPEQPYVAVRGVGPDDGDRGVRRPVPGGDLLAAGGVPLSARDAEAADEVTAGVLPAGRYVATTHTRHPRELEQATGRLLAWAAARHLRWDLRPVNAVERWGCRLENYLSDPDEEPDMTRWRTELAFRLADDPDGTR